MKYYDELKYIGISLGILGNIKSIYTLKSRSGKEIVVIIEEDNQIKQILISTLMPYPSPETLQDEKTDYIKTTKNPKR